MGATDDMIGIMPPIIVAGAVTRRASTMFPDNKPAKTRTKYKIKYKYITKSATKKPTKRKSKGGWASKNSKVIRKYL